MASLSEKLLIKLGLDQSKLQKDLKVTKYKFNHAFKEIKDGALSLATGSTITAGTALAIGIAESSKEIESLRYQMGMSKKDTESLSQSVYDLNKSLGLKDAKESARYLKEVRSISGFTGKSLQDLAVSSGLIGKEFGDQEGVLRSQVSLMRSFGVGIKESADGITYLQKKGGDLKGELNEGLLEYAKDFKAAGFSFKDSILFAEQGLKTGWNFDKVGDLVKEMNLRIKGNDVSAKKTLSQLGLPNLISEVQEGKKTVIEAIQEIYSGKFSQLGNKQLELGKNIFGTQFEDVGREQVKEIFQGMRKELKLSNQFKMLQEDIKERTSFKLDTSMSSLSNSFNRMIRSFEPVIIPIIEKIDSFFTGVSEFTVKFPNITKSVVNLSLALGGLALSLGAFKILKGSLKMITAPLSLLSILPKKSESHGSSFGDGFKKGLGSGMKGIGKMIFGKLLVGFKVGLTGFALSALPSILEDAFNAFKAIDFSKELSFEGFKEKFKIPTLEEIKKDWEVATNRTSRDFKNLLQLDLNQIVIDRKQDRIIDAKESYTHTIENRESAKDVEQRITGNSYRNEYVTRNETKTEKKEYHITNHIYSNSRDVKSDLLDLSLVYGD